MVTDVIIDYNCPAEGEALKDVAQGGVGVFMLFYSPCACDVTGIY